MYSVHRERKNRFEVSVYVSLFVFPDNRFTFRLNFNAAAVEIGQRYGRATYGDFNISYKSHRVESENDGNA